jgi:hypothetical protein
MRRFITTTLAIAIALCAHAQGNNTGLGGEDGDYQSLAERVFKLEKKTKAINFYFNYSTSFQINYDGKDWGTSFKNKQARVEIKGDLTKKLSYRFRHRLNRTNVAQDEDNFAKATDILMVGYQFTEKFGIQGGKFCKNWGGFEFDENPIYIYQHSDYVSNMNNFVGGINISYKPIPTQEFAINVANTYNNKFNTVYGDDPIGLAYSKTNGTTTEKGLRKLEKSNNPLTYILFWKGSFFGDRLQTRYGFGIETFAKHEYGRTMLIGQKLNLPNFQIYLDYMGTSEGLDRMMIASNDAAQILEDAGAGYAMDVRYNSFVSKANWQFAPQWNLMLKGMYETVSVPKVDVLKDYRKSYAYMASVEYYPEKTQDFRVFLAYVGRKYDFKKACGLSDYNTNRIELGFIYRIKIL